MPIATDGKGNYLTLDSSGAWVPTSPPQQQQQGSGELGYAAAPPEPAAAASRGLGAFNQQPSPGLSAAEGRVGSAIAEGWKGPAFLTPEAKARAEADNQQTWVGRNIISPAVSLSEVPFRAMNAVGAGIGQAAYEVGNAAGGPAGGRDAYMLQQLLPSFGAFPEAPRVAIPRQLPEPPPPARFVQEHFNEPVPGAAGPPTEPYGPPMPQYGPPRPPEQFGPPKPPPTPGATQMPDWLGGGEYRPPGVEPPRGGAPPSPQPATPPSSLAPGVPTHELAPGGTAGPRETAPVAPPPAVTAEAQPAGAQITPASELGVSPREEAAYRSTAEGNKLLEPQEPGVRDDKQYLHGERVNEAEASQDVGVARELKSLRQQTPKLDASMTADENHNNNLRYNAINNAIPGQVQITAAKMAREEAMKTAEPKVFANATDADVQPIVKTIQEILNDPLNRENSQLQQYVKPLIDRLQNPDGTPKITDPKQLWGWRQDVQHLTSGAAQAADPNLSRVSGILGKVLDVTDDQIEGAAKGYKPLLRDEYRTRSREIDAMEALNGERFKLFDSQNVPNYNAVQSLMRRMIDARQANDPYEPFTHVPQETLNKFWDIRDSMRRSRAADRLAAPKGSPTSQNFGDAMRAAGRMAAQSAAPAIGATLGATFIPIPGVGPALGLGVGAAVNHLFSERAMGQRFARGMELTNPNRLMQPPTP